MNELDNLDDSKKGFSLGKRNYRLMIIGCVIVIIGFILMSGGGSEDPNVFNGEELFSDRRLKAAPLTVFFGYMFIIYAILSRPK